MFDQNDGRISRRGEMASEEAPRASSLDVIGELAARMKKLESEHAALKAMVNDARERGEIGFDFEHAQHVLTKHFHHDRPEAEAPPVPSAKFDPFTGERLSVN